MRLLSLILLLVAAPAWAAEDPSPAILEALHYTGVGSADLVVDDGVDALALPATAAQIAAATLDADTPVEALQAAWSLRGIEAGAALVEAPPEGALADACTRRQDQRKLRRLDPQVTSAMGHLVAVVAAVEAMVPPLDGPTARHAVEIAAAPASRAERFLREDAAAAEALWTDEQLGATAQASTAALATVLTLGDELSGRTASWPERATELWTDAGRVWIGSTGPDVFSAPFVAVLDPGGDDLYTGDGVPQRATLVVDLAGDDSYRQLPVALGGVVLIVDVGGDDDHLGGTLGPAGAAWGASILVDRAGDDRYRGGPWSLGAGLDGVGLLLDGDGDDLYAGEAPTQGVAAAGGVGLLVDHGGHDSYDARGGPGAQGHAAGLGPWRPGGVGALLDGDGDDRYGADRRAQGSGDHRGLGVLVDRAGDDRYAATAWSQGAATHGGRGVLYDATGHDRYDLDRSGQGRAHDRAAALLWDTSGEDRYRAGGDAQGSASGNAVALLVDGAGDDRFDAGGDGDAWGAATPLRGAGSIALLLDGGGDDRYALPVHRGDDAVRWSSRHGLAVDRGLPSRPAPTESPATAAPATDEELDAVLDQATGADPGLATEATARLVAAGPEGWTGLRRRLRVDEPITAAVVGDVAVAMARRDPAHREALGTALRDELATGEPTPEAALLLIILGRMGADSSDIAADYLKHDDPSNRAAAAAVLGVTCSGESGPALVTALGADPADAVRAAAARALPSCPHEDAVPALAGALEDPALAVRDNAARSLVLLARGGERDAVRDAVRDPAAVGVIPALEVLARVSDPTSRPALEQLLLDSEDPALRGHAALALGAIGDSLSRKALMGREAVEADPFVRLCLDRALRTPGNAPAIAPELP